MFPKREKFGSVQEFLEKCHVVLHKRLKKDLPGAEIKDISSYAESHFIIKVKEIFLISLSEIKSHTQPHFILMVQKVDVGKSTAFHFQDLAALYQLFINLAKNESFLNNISLLSICLSDLGYHSETIFIEKNPFSPDI
jgi:hypothetical protein